jgi:hypothetical protein
VDRPDDIARVLALHTESGLWLRHCELAMRLGLREDRIIAWIAFDMIGAALSGMIHIRWPDGED